MNKINIKMFKSDFNRLLEKAVNNADYYELAELFSPGEKITPGEAKKRIKEEFIKEYNVVFIEDLEKGGNAK